MNEQRPDATAKPEATPPPANLSPLATISSEAVLRGQTAVDIEHNGQRYRLQTTRQGKLILTK